MGKVRLASTSHCRPLISLSHSPQLGVRAPLLAAATLCRLSTEATHRRRRRPAGDSCSARPATGGKIQTEPRATGHGLPLGGGRGRGRGLHLPGHRRRPGIRERRRAAIRRAVASVARFRDLRSERGGGGGARTRRRSAARPGRQNWPTPSGPAPRSSRRLACCQTWRLAVGDVTRGSQIGSARQKGIRRINGWTAFGITYKLGFYCRLQICRQFSSFVHWAQIDGWKED